MRAQSLVFGLLASSLGACSRPEHAPKAPSAVTGLWYINASLDPQDTSVLGLPMRDLDSTWTRGIVLAPSVLPAAAAEESATRPTQNFGYRLAGDFNRDGKPDSAVVGVYRSTTGSKGPFVLIVTRSGGGWKKAFSVGMTGVSDVTFLARAAGDTLVWNDCVACDAPAVKIYWDGVRYVAKWENE
jgi:hypothetical protein